MMSDMPDHVYDFLATVELDPKKMNDRMVQFWFKEESYYLRFFKDRQDIRIFHPRVYYVESHMEFGVATFVGNTMNKHAFGTKVFVNDNDNYVYAASEMFVADIEQWKDTFFDYMNAISRTIVEFRDRTAEAMEAEAGENPE